MESDLEEILENFEEHEENYGENYADLAAFPDHLRQQSSAGLWSRNMAR